MTEIHSADAPARSQLTLPKTNIYIYILLKNPRWYTLPPVIMDLENGIPPI